jgi:hypothetical protein
MGKEKDGEVEIYTFFLFVVYFTPRWVTSDYREPNDRTGE